MNQQPLHFLLVEDDDDHAELILMALSDNRITNTVDRVSDGAEALIYLRREEQHSLAPKADIILLDLNLPKVSGLEVLEAIKSDDMLRSTPVVILTTSAAESDRAKAYHFHANSYLVKPLEFEQFHQMIKDLKYYWAAWNQPPVVAQTS